MPEDQGFLLSTLIDDGRSRQPYALRTKILINCAGLGALQLAAMAFDEVELVVCATSPQQRPALPDEFQGAGQTAGLPRMLTTGHAPVGLPEQRRELVAQKPRAVDRRVHPLGRNPAP